MSKLVYGEFVVDVEDLPQVSVDVLLQRGFTHLLGNEVASKVSAKVKGVAAEGLGIKVGEVESSEISQWRAEHGEEVAGFTAEARQEYVRALIAGAVGIKPGRAGNAESKLEKLKRKIAWEEIKAVLGSRGIDIPRGEQVVSFANGEAFGKEELIDRRLGNVKHGPRIEEQAKGELAALRAVAGEEADL
jgi:hypothetical protein